MAVRLPEKSEASRKPVPCCRRHRVAVAVMPSAHSFPLPEAPAAESSAAEQVRRPYRRCEGRAGKRPADLGRLKCGARRGGEGRGRTPLSGEPSPRLLAVFLASAPPPPPGPRGHIRAPRRSAPVTPGGRCCPPAPGRRNWHGAVALAWVTTLDFPSLTRSVGGSGPHWGGTWSGRGDAAPLGCSLVLALVLSASVLLCSAFTKFYALDCSLEKWN